MQTLLANFTTVSKIRGVAVTTGWESEGPGFEPRQWLQATFDPGLPKKTK